MRISVGHSTCPGACRERAFATLYSPRAPLSPAPKAMLPRAGGRRARPNAVQVRAGYLRNGNGCATHYQLVQVSPRCPLDRCTHLISTLVREILASPRATPHSQCQRLLSSSASSEMKYDARWRVVYPFCDAHGHISDKMATRGMQVGRPTRACPLVRVPRQFRAHRSALAARSKRRQAAGETKPSIFLNVNAIANGNGVGGTVLRLEEAQGVWRSVAQSVASCGVGEKYAEDSRATYVQSRGGASGSFCGEPLRGYEVDKS
jgi:hypothetical protein